MSLNIPFKPTDDDLAIQAGLDQLTADFVTSSNTLEQLVVELTEAGFSRDKVGLMVQHVRDALERSRIDAIIRAGERGFGGVEPLPPCPFQDIGARVVSAKSREEQK